MRRLIISFSILVLAAGPAWADSDRDARLDRVMALQQRQADRSANEFEDPELTPMLAEIKAVLDSARSVEQELVASHPDGSAETPGSPLAMRLAAHKKATHLQVLRIQARYARLDGRTELEQRILTSIAEIERPATPGAPRMKPVPKPTAGSTNAR
jgi:hypothetical protein